MYSKLMTSVNQHSHGLTVCIICKPSSPVPGPITVPLTRRYFSALGQQRGTGATNM